MLLNCGVREDSWESLDWKEIQSIHPGEDQYWVVSKETGFTHGDVTYNIGGRSGVMSKVVWLLQLRDFFSPSSPSSLVDWHSEIPWRPLSCLLGSTASVVSSWVPTTIPYHCAAGIYPLPRWSQILWEAQLDFWSCLRRQTETPCPFHWTTMRV